MQPYMKVKLDVYTSIEETSLGVSISHPFLGDRAADKSDNIHPKLKQVSECRTHLSALRNLKNIEQKNPDVLQTIEKVDVGRGSEWKYTSIQGAIQEIHKLILIPDLEFLQEVEDFLNDVTPPQIEISFWGKRLIRLGRNTLTLADLMERISFVAENSKYVPSTDLESLGAKLNDKVSQYLKKSDDKLKERNYFTRVVEWIRNHCQWVVNGRQPLQKIFEIMQVKLIKH